MLRGISTVSFFAEDLPAARSWYARLLGIEPYFEMPGYFEFRIGDQQVELGFIDARYAPHALGAPAGVVVYWHVDDLAETLDDLLAAGAREHQPVVDRGHGFVTASVVDPFGNVLGVMTNPHYLEVLGEKPSA